MRSFPFLILLLFSLPMLAQSPKKEIKKPAGAKQTVSAGFTLPVGAFSDTHFGGIAAEYTCSNGRFGKLTVLPAKKFGLIGKGGIAYYFGKKETISGYQYDYPAYIFIHAYPGIICTAGKKFNLQLAAGPALVLYNGTTRFYIGSTLSATYYISEKWGIEPSLLLMKEKGADPLFSASVKAVMGF